MRTQILNALTSLGNHPGEIAENLFKQNCISQDVFRKYIKDNAPLKIFLQKQIHIAFGKATICAANFEGQFRIILGQQYFTFLLRKHLDLIATTDAWKIFISFSRS